MAYPRILFTAGWITLTVLAIPFIASFFTREVQWSGTDYLVMGALVFALGWLVLYLKQNIASTSVRILAIAAVFLLFLALWAEMAVGIFGSPLAGS